MTEREARPPTLKDVALAAGVHPGTVSRALNAETRSRVNAATVKRVLRVAEALGYQPNPIARSLRTSKTHTIGMLIPDLTNPLFPPIVRGVDRVLSAQGYTLLLANTDNSAERERRQYAALRARQIDGLVVATALREHPLLDQVHDEHIPVVLVNRLTEGRPALAVVGDEASGVRQAVDHLVALGHREIACIAGPHTTSTGRERVRVFGQAMAAHGLTPGAGRVVECGAWSEAEGARALTELLDTAPGFTAVIAGNDLLALGCYDVMRGRGLSCPGDISLVGFNDMPFADKFAPPLTTVRLPNDQIGQEAAKLLLERIADSGTATKTITLPVELIVRESTAPLR